MVDFFIVFNGFACGFAMNNYSMAGVIISSDGIVRQHKRLKGGADIQSVVSLLLRTLERPIKCPADFY